MSDQKKKGVLRARKNKVTKAQSKKRPACWLCACRKVLCSNTDPKKETGFPCDQCKARQVDSECTCAHKDDPRWYTGMTSKGNNSNRAEDPKPPKARRSRRQKNSRAAPNEHESSDSDVDIDVPDAPSPPVAGPSRRSSRSALHSPVQYIDNGGSDDDFTNPPVSNIPSGVFGAALSHRLSRVTHRSGHAAVDDDLDVPAPLAAPNPPEAGSSRRSSRIIHDAPFHHGENVGSASVESNGFTALGGDSNSSGGPDNQATKVPKEADSESDALSELMLIESNLGSVALQPRVRMILNVMYDKAGAGDRAGMLLMRRLLDRAATQASSAHTSAPSMASGQAAGPDITTGPAFGVVDRSTLLRRSHQRLRQIIARRDEQNANQQ